MKIAIPVWNGRVSPVLDVAKTIRIAEVVGGELEGVETLAVSEGRLSSVLSRFGVDALVCSAVSSPLEATLWMSGIEVISDVCGIPEEILEALASGDTTLDRFRSPGSRRRSESPRAGRRPSPVEGTGTPR